MDLMGYTIQSITQGKGMDSNHETEFTLFKSVVNLVLKVIRGQHKTGMACVVVVIIIVNFNIIKFM